LIKSGALSQVPAANKRTLHLVLIRGDRYEYIHDHGEIDFNLTSGKTDSNNERNKDGDRRAGLQIRGC
jgi:hypothetical protein